MTVKFKIPPIENSPGFIVHQLDLLLKSGLQRSFQSEGINITVEQWAILGTLWEREGIHQSAIADKIGKDRHTVTRMLTLMDKHGFVRRVPTEEDKRRLNVFLTDRGWDMQGKLLPIVQRYLERAFTGLTQEEAKEFVRVLRHIVSNLETLQA